MKTVLGHALFCAGVIALVGTSAGAQNPHGPSPRAEQIRHAGPTRITQKQRENMQARIDLAASIVARFDSEAKARGLGSGWRQASLEVLLPLSLAALERASREAISMDSLAAVAAEAADDPTVLGSELEDLVYKPISPCRFIDTRNYAGGAINGSRNFDLSLTGASYGGFGACNPIALIGANIIIGGFAANLTIVGPAAAPGFAAIKSSGGDPISSLVNWYAAGPDVQVANAGIFRTGVSLFGNPFVIQTSASTHVLLDLFGFFIPPQATALQMSVQQVTSPIGDGASGHLVSPNCPAGYTLTGGGCHTDAFHHILESTNPVGVSSWECWTRNNSGGVSNLTAFAMCSRVPGR